MSYRFLISEDEERVSKYWRKALEKEYPGCEVIEAHDGAVALKAWQQQGFDLILLDLLTPKLKGGAILSEIRKIQPWTQVIIISGQGKEEDKMHAIREHVWDYLEKPVPLDTFVQVVDAALKNRDPILRGVSRLVHTCKDPDALWIGVAGTPITARQLYEAVRMGTELGLKYREALEDLLFEVITYPELNRAFRDVTLFD